jgi:hypothetical protein
MRSCLAFFFSFWGLGNTQEKKLGIPQFDICPCLVVTLFNFAYDAALD